MSTNLPVLFISTSTTQQSPPPPPVVYRQLHSPKMVARIVARRAFSTTRAQLSSPYHYPEGPRSNLPFNTKTRFFALRYWGFLVTGFVAPFGIVAWQTYKPKA
ncbi:hypothetical protein NKR19_g9103 [Coniochaeta hoffmannii]|uniref:Cytochrome c oxidase subunit 8, mitochondrial n=1 Tax=Coniochaeta hoffmannii TaxID=91930 RepID=A0AA38R254_9PEZI|nr:hypothetical protein NKR19_g9103 [Coniochaeta hoffmannii]